MQRLTRESLLMKLGAAQSKAPAAWRLATVEIAVQGVLRSASGSIAKSCVKRVGARGAICYAPISPDPIRQTMGILPAFGGRRGGVQNAQG